MNAIQTATVNKKDEILNWLTALVLVAAMLVLASCGGGGASAALPAPQNTNKPAAGTADLSGQLIQAGGARVLSTAGSGLSDVSVTLINSLTGGKIGTDITDNFGKFEFSGVPSGNHNLVKLEFQTASDLNGDGQPDQIELFFPVSLADQAVTTMQQSIGVADSNGDGSLDALEVQTNLTDDNGRAETSSSQHRRRDGETRIDSNGNGSFDDDQGFDDSDSDGLEDASDPSDDSSQSGQSMELELKGQIEEITDTTITVAGTTFALADSTEWKLNDGTGGPSDFQVGMFVEIEGIADGNGGWIALKVQSEDAGMSDGSGSGSGSGDDSMDDNSGDGSGSGSDDSMDDNSGDSSGSGDDSSTDDGSGDGSGSGDDSSTDDGSGDGSGSGDDSSAGDGSGDGSGSGDDSSAGDGSGDDGSSSGGDDGSDDGSGDGNDGGGDN